MVDVVEIKKKESAVKILRYWLKVLAQGISSGPDLDMWRPWAAFSSGGPPYLKILKR